MGCSVNRLSRRDEQSGLFRQAYVSAQQAAIKAQFSFSRRQNILLIVNQSCLSFGVMQDKLTETIIGCAYRVFNILGFGFLESVYKKSLLIELEKQGLKAAQEVAIIVFYDGQSVGEFFADVLVEDSVILELKSIQKLAVAHEVQLVNYLVATKKDVGLLLNFGPNGVEVKRKFRKPRKAI